jgi:hypothetical protein
MLEILQLRFAQQLMRNNAKSCVLSLDHLGLGSTRTTRLQQLHKTHTDVFLLSATKSYERENVHHLYQLQHAVMTKPELLNYSPHFCSTDSLPIISAQCIGLRNIAF